jgi:multiple sugar transport system ATP-binding protein
VVMHDGVVEQMGAPLELYDKPANVFVASFIGSPAMNLIDGEVVSGDFGTQFATKDGIRLPLPQGIAAQPGRAVVYGVRPEHLKVSEDGVPTTIRVTEPTGSETEVVVQLGAQELTGLFRERLALSPGKTLTLRPDTAHIHLFDKASGQRI